MSFTKPAERTWIILAFIVVYVFWGSTFLAIRISVETIPPLLVGAFRNIFGGLLVLALVRTRLGPLIFDWRSAGAAGFVGILTNGIANGSLIAAERSVPSSIAAISFTTMPLMMLLLNWFSFEKVTPALSDFLAIAGGMMGAALVILSGETLQGSSLSGIDICRLVACPFFWSLGSLAGRRLAMPSSILLSAGLQMLGGGLFLAILGTGNGDWGRLIVSPPSTLSWWGVLYLTFLGSFLGYTAFAYLIKNVDSRLAGTFAFVNPLVALGLGLLWGGENLLSVPVIGGAFLAISSVAVLMLSKLVKARRLRPE